MYTDNARTFKRASRELCALWKTIRHADVQAYFAASSISWKFIVEGAPWWGGFYERLVRSIKLTLKKMLGRRLVDAAELSTILNEVEAIVNSRPLTFVFNDVSESTPLSPACFLIGRRLTALPPSDELISQSTLTSLKRMWGKRERMLD